MHSFRAAWVVHGPVGWAVMPAKSQATAAWDRGNWVPATVER
jgi:hypothetical protein